MAVPFSPTVSVILPTYNRAHLLDRAVQSVLNQSFNDWELIIIDDGSADHTADIINGYKDKRIVLLRHRYNRGDAASRNTGIRASKGQWIAFQDSDDVWLPDKLRQQMLLADKIGEDHRFVFTKMWRTSPNSSKIVPASGLVAPRQAVTDALLQRRLMIGTSTLMVRRDCFNQVGLFDERFRAASDFEMRLRLSRITPFAMVDNLLVLSFVQPDSLTTARHLGERINALEMIWLKHSDLFKNKPEATAIHFLAIGKCCFTANLPRKGWGYVRRALRINCDRRLLGKWFVDLALHHAKCRLFNHPPFGYEKQIEIALRGTSGSQHLKKKNRPAQAPTGSFYPSLVTPYAPILSTTAPPVSPAAQPANRR